MLFLQYIRHIRITVLLLAFTCLLSGFRLFGQAQAARVDEALTAVCGESEERASYSERLQLIHRLPSGLDAEQLERCREFLESPLAGQPLPDLEFNGLKNDMAEVFDCQSGRKIFARIQTDGENINCRKTISVYLMAILVDVSLDSCSLPARKHISLPCTCKTIQ